MQTTNIWLGVQASSPRCFTYISLVLKTMPARYCFLVKMRKLWFGATARHPPKNLSSKWQGWEFHVQPSIISWTRGLNHYATLSLVKWGKEGGRREGGEEHKKNGENKGGLKAAGAIRFHSIFSQNGPFYVQSHFEPEVRTKAFPGRIVFKVNSETNT